MSRIVLCTLLCGVLVGPVWAKGHHGAPMMPPRGGVPARAAVGQQRAFNQAAVNQQRAMGHAMGAAAHQQQAFGRAAINQQRAMGHAAMTQAKMQQHAIRHVPPPPHVGPGPMPYHSYRGRGFWRGPAPHDLHHWRRGPAPHAHYRSCWYDDVWYDAYGYPYYYGTTVVAPAPVIAPAPVVVTPAPVVAPPPPVVVTPAPVVAPPPPVVVTPPPPPPAVVY